MFAQQTPRFTSFFFFNDTATTEIYTLSLHDALPISAARSARPWASPCSPPPSTAGRRQRPSAFRSDAPRCSTRSEEHTSELQSHLNLVCRLLLEKKKKHKLEAIHNAPENQENLRGTE